MTLDVPERQVLVFLAARPEGKPWHHRVLHTQIEGPKYVHIDPGGGVGTTDLTAQDVILLERASAYPPERVRRDDFLCYDNDNMLTYQKECENATTLAEWMGIKAGPSEKLIWVVYDITSSNLGMEWERPR